MPFLKSNIRKPPPWKEWEKLTLKTGFRHAIVGVRGHNYIGEWNLNSMEGKGSRWTQTGKLYEGDWERGYRHGYGTLALQKQDRTFVLDYAGDWKNGHYHGYGMKLYPDGGIYIGWWKNSKRHGFGTMWYADGSFYQGDWLRGNRHGLGIFVQVNGNRYEGSWELDLKHGRGRFYHLDSGQVQEGVWHEGIAKCSTMVDIPYRQSAVDPTYYAIRKDMLVYTMHVIRNKENNVLAGRLSETSIIQSPSQVSELF